MPKPAIVLTLPAQAAALLARAGGEPADDLHCTLVSLTDGDMEKVIDAVRVIAATTAPMPAALGPLGYFAGVDGDTMDCMHLAVACPGLVALRAAIVAALTAEGATVATDFEFDPHVTLAYIPKVSAAATLSAKQALAAEPKTYGSLVFGTIAVWEGGERTSFRLSGTAATLACGDKLDAGDTVTPDDTDTLDAGDTVTPDDTDTLSEDDVDGDTMDAADRAGNGDDDSIGDGLTDGVTTIADVINPEAIAKTIPAPQENQPALIASIPKENNGTGYTLSAAGAGRERARLKAAVSLPAEVPTRLRLFKWGENDTQKGIIVLDTDGAAEAIAAFTLHGVDVPVDFDHNTFSDEPVKKDTAGYYARLETDDEGLFAAGIRWTQLGLEAITPGKDPQGNPTVPQYRYYSPYVEFEAVTRRLVGVGPLAITTWPATRNQQPMMLDAAHPAGPGASAVTTPAKPAPVPAKPATAPTEKASVRLAQRTRPGADKRTRTAKLDGMPDATLSFDDIRSAVCDALQSQFVDAWVQDLNDETAVFMFGGALFSVAYTMSGSAAVLAGAATEVQRTYTPVPGGRSMNTVIETLSLNTNASEAEVLKAVNGMIRVQTEVLRALDVATPAEAVSAVEDLKASKSRLEAIEQENKDLKLQLENKDRDALILQGKREGKFTVANCNDFRKDSLEQVRKYLAVMPVQAALLSSERKTEVKGRDGQTIAGGRITLEDGRGYEKLSNMERVALKQRDAQLFEDMRTNWLEQDHRKGAVTA